jgi:hypothetical protein
MAEKVILLYPFFVVFKQLFGEELFNMEEKVFISTEKL